MYPGIEDTRSVDAEQDTQAGLLGGVVDMSKGVDARLRIVVHVAQHAIYHARRTSSGGNLARIQHVQRQGIVGLVSTTIGDGGAGLQSQLGGSGLTYHTLFCKGGNDVSNERLVETIVVHQEVSHAVVLEVPEHTFG